MMDDESETCLAKLNKLLSFYESSLIFELQFLNLPMVSKSSVYITLQPRHAGRVVTFTFSLRGVRGLCPVTGNCPTKIVCMLR